MLPAALAAEPEEEEPELEAARFLPLVRWGICSGQVEAVPRPASIAANN